MEGVSGCLASVLSYFLDFFVAICCVQGGSVGCAWYGVEEEHQHAVKKITRSLRACDPDAQAL